MTLDSRADVSQIAQRNNKRFPLQQSGEVCGRGLLAAGTHADGQPVPAVCCRLWRTTHGRVNCGANGHELQRHVGGLRAASHQAPVWHQCGTLQEAGIPHELQAAGAFTNESMTLGLPTNTRTLQILPLLPSYHFLSKRLVEIFKNWLTLSTPITSSSSSAFPFLASKILLTQPDLLTDNQLFATVWWIWSVHSCLNDRFLWCKENESKI